MGTLANGNVIAPFANAAMRLLREDWKGKYGSKMLAEELFPILQTGIPQPDQNFQNFITINAGEDGKLLSLIDKFGNEIYKIEEFGPNQINKGLQPIEPAGYPPVKLKPRIVWGPKTINAGESIDAGELDAVAFDPETGDEVAGVYVYDPPSGTTFGSAGMATLYVNFTPTDGVKYRRSMGNTVLTVVAVPEPTFGYLAWTPGDIWADGTLGVAQLNATARDANTNLPIVGSYAYTPANGSTFPAPATIQGTIHCDFTPSSPADLATYGIVSRDADVSVLGIFAVSRSAQSHSTTVGDLIVVGAFVGDAASGATVTVNDTQGNTYTQIGTYIESGSGGSWSSVSLWYAFAGATGANSITINTSGVSPSLITSKYLLYTGSISFDGTSNASGNGGTPSSGTTPVSGTRELIVFMATDNVDAGASVTYAFPWNTSRRDNAKDSLYENWAVDPITGASSPFAIITGGTVSGRWAIITASFRHRTS